MLIFSLPNGDHEVVATVGGTSIAATFTVTGSTYLSGIDYSAASIHVEPVSAAPGAVVTINGSGFPPFGLVQQLVLGGTDVLPVPQPHTYSAGNFITQILIPQLGLGNTQVDVAIGGTSASTPITIGSAIPASITVEPQSAEPGQVVTITGSGFTPFVSMRQLAINASGMGSISVLPDTRPFTNASGEFKTGVLIPGLPNGDHEVAVTVGSTSTAAIFTVTGSTYLSGQDYPAASINVEPVTAAPGAVVTITGSGFPPFGLVQQLGLGGINVLPMPQPNTDSVGNFIALVTLFRIKW